MKLIQTMAVVVVVGAAGRAEAQGFNSVPGAILLGEGAFATSSIFTGVLATQMAVDANPGFSLIPCAALGALNAALGVGLQVAL